jgi:adenylyl- and sulfurtransferase ThiI
LDKLSDSLKKDVLTRKVKVKKSDLIALGEFPASNERIQSGAELEQVLAQNIQQTALSSSTIKTPLEEPAQTLDQMIEHIIVIAQSLNKPSINQKEACLDLINQAQHLLTIIQERD